MCTINGMTFRAPLCIYIFCSNWLFLRPDVLRTISGLLHRHQTPAAFWLGPHLYVAVARPADIKVKHDAMLCLSVSVCHFLLLHACYLSCRLC